MKQKQVLNERLYQRISGNTLSTPNTVILHQPWSFYCYLYNHSILEFGWEKDYFIEYRLRWKIRKCNVLVRVILNVNFMDSYICIQL